MSLVFAFHEHHINMVHFWMTPSKKKLLKPKDISLDPSIKVETPIMELPNDETSCLMKKMMLGPPPSQIFPYLVRMRRKKRPAMYGNMLLMSYSNCPHSILKGKV